MEGLPQSRAFRLHEQAVVLSDQEAVSHAGNVVADDAMGRLVLRLGGVEGRQVGI